jgi:cytochrome c oxidase assembly protein subunit 15
MPNEDRILQPQRSPWPHRWAVVLACATFPLIWVGGLVTTTDAGMAVPDWPTTFGYNPFLYPLSTWFAAPWDIFVEHGHRLLGALVGLLTIILTVSVVRHDHRAWMRLLAGAALALVIIQGMLGGMRVRLDERTLAMLHGCIGPLFFAVTVALAVVTCGRWQGAGPPLAGARGAHVRRLAVVTCVLVYLQILLGAVLRHVPVDEQPDTFVLAVQFHLLMAGIVSIHILWLAWSVLRRFRRVPPLGRLAGGLVALIFVQLALGAGTWIVNYAVPQWAAGWLPASVGGGAIVHGGWLQTHVVTAHAAIGSALLAVSLSLALHSLRLLAAPQTAGRLAARKLEPAR